MIFAARMNLILKGNSEEAITTMIVTVREQVFRRNGSVTRDLTVS